MDWTQPEMFPATARPPQALSLSARWDDGSGWTVVASARRYGRSRWHTVELRNGSVLTVDELVTVLEALLICALDSESDSDESPALR